MTCKKIGNIAISRVVTKVVEPRWKNLSEEGKKLVRKQHNRNKTTINNMKKALLCSGNRNSVRAANSPNIRNPLKAIM